MNKENRKIYKKWWFWTAIILVIVVIFLVMSTGPDSRSTKRPSIEILPCELPFQKVDSVNRPILNSEEATAGVMEYLIKNTNLYDYYLEQLQIGGTLTLTQVNTGGSEATKEIWVFEKGIFGTRFAVDKDGGIYSSLDCNPEFEFDAVLKK